MTERKLRSRKQYETHCGNVCCNCGTTENIQYHHIVPISVGGADEYSNIVAICQKCHCLTHGSKNLMNHRQLLKAGIKKRKDEGGSWGRPSRYNEDTLDYIYHNCISFGGNMGDWQIREQLGIGITRYCQLKKKTMAKYGITEFKQKYVRR